MSDESQGPGWWLASDGKWYPPESAPGAPPQYTPPPSYGQGDYGQQGFGAPMGGPATNADVGSAVSYGWKKFQQNAGPLLGIILIPIAIQFVLQFFGRVVFNGIVGSLFFLILAEVVSLAAAIGIVNAALMITAGQPADIARAFSSDRWGEWILFAFVWGLMVGVGLLFCGVGALVVIAIWGLAPFYFIDQRMSLGEALSASSRATAATPGLRVALALTALVGIAGVIACGVGVLVTMP